MPIQIKINIMQNTHIFKILNIFFKIEFIEKSSYLTRLYLFPTSFLLLSILLIIFYKKIIAYLILSLMYIYNMNKIQYYKKYIINTPYSQYAIQKIQKIKNYISFKLKNLEKMEIK